MLGMFYRKKDALFRPHLAVRAQREGQGDGKTEVSVCCITSCFPSPFAHFSYAS